MIFLSAIIMAVSLNHLFLAFKLRSQPYHFAIFLAGLTGAAYFFLVRQGYECRPVPENLHLIYRFQLVFLQICSLSVLWALSILFGQNSRKWLLLISISLGICLTLTLLLPGNLLFSGKSSVSLAIILGNPVNLPDDVRGWRILTDVTMLLTILWLLRLTVRQMVDGYSRWHFHLLVITGLLFLFAVADHLTDFGRLNMIYLLPPGFFILYGFLSSFSLERLLEDVRVNAEIALEERKWRRMFQEVKLIMVELDRTGHIRYVNPFFLELTGYKEEEVLGHDWFELIVPQESAYDVQSAFLELLTNDFHPTYKNPISTHDQQEKMILWYNVRIRDRHDKISGSVSIGVDITHIHNETGQLEKSLQEAREVIASLQRDKSR